MMIRTNPFKLKPKKISDNVIYNISTLFFKISLILWNRLEVYNAHLIPKSGGILIVTNHASYLDPPIIGVAARYRPVHFMARNTLWKNKFAKWWLNNVCCVPVSRDTGDIAALKKSISILKNGKVLSIFPEGTRTIDGNLQDAKSGVGFIIEKSKCVVVPAYIDGSFKSFSKNCKWIKPNKIKIIFANPIDNNDFLSLGEGKGSYDLYADLIMRKIKEIKDTI